MLKDITIGQYYPADTAVHRLDPRFKIVIMFAFIISLFFIKSYTPYLFIVLWLLLVIKVSQVPLARIIKGLRPLRYIILITFVMNMLFIPGEVLWQWKIITITREGLNQALFMAIRLILLVVGMSLLTLTTSPIELTDGIEKLFGPLKRFGFPAHELAMMMTIALRFIPTLIEETDKIMKAQMARGADFDSGSLMARAKGLIPLLVPLFINALRRADELANAMEARCYQGEGIRTRLNELEMTSEDKILFTGNMIFLIFICCLRLFPLP